jgi:hypothetical protein
MEPRALTGSAGPYSIDMTEQVVGLVTLGSRQVVDLARLAYIGADVVSAIGRARACSKGRMLRDWNFVQLKRVSVIKPVPILSYTSVEAMTLYSWNELLLSLHLFDVAN